MSWTDIIGQDSAKRKIERAVLQGRVHQSYVFCGQLQSGQLPFALEFARVLNCESRLDNSNSSCGKCKSCVMLSSLSHPDLTIIYPTTALKSDERDSSKSEVSDVLAEISQEPYKEYLLHDKGTINVKSIRTLRQSLSLSHASEASWRVIIVYRADAMTAESSNALLKSLEEPHDRTIFIFIVEKRDSLFLTIRSRSQFLNFSPLSPQETYTILTDRLFVDSDSVRQAQHRANNSVSELLQRINDTSEVSRDVESDFLRFFSGENLNPSRVALGKCLESLTKKSNDWIVEPTLIRLHGELISEADEILRNSSRGESGMIFRYRERLDELHRETISAIRGNGTMGLWVLNYSIRILKVRSHFKKMIS